MNIRYPRVKALLLASLMGMFVTPAADADSIDFTTWTSEGDVVAGSGTASMSTNALFSDDSPGSDGDFNFSGTGASLVGDLESELGLPSGILDPDPPLDTAAEGSGVAKTLTFLDATIVSFDWTFLTNEDELGLNDYAFIVIDGTLETLVSAYDPGAQVSGTAYAYEFTGTFSRVFGPGTYDVAIGVVDLNDFAVSSALVLDNATFTVIPTPSAALLGLPMLAGVCLRRRGRV